MARATNKVRSRGESFTLQWQSAANMSRIGYTMIGKVFSLNIIDPFPVVVQTTEAANYKYLSSSMRNRRKLHARRNVNACSTRVWWSSMNKCACRKLKCFDRPGNFDQMSNVELIALICIAKINFHLDTRRWNMAFTVTRSSTASSRFPINRINQAAK